MNDDDFESEIGPATSAGLPVQPAPRVVGPGFNARVYAVVRRVPPGRITTYGDVATVLGSPRVARHVGFALAALRDPTVPWHRVINSRGRISFKGDTARGIEQQQRLMSEGIIFSAAGVVSLKRFRHDLQP